MSVPNAGFAIWAIVIQPPSQLECGGARTFAALARFFRIGARRPAGAVLRARAVRNHGRASCRRRSTRVLGRARAVGAARAFQASFYGRPATPDRLRRAGPPALAYDAQGHRLSRQRRSVTAFQHP